MKIGQLIAILSKMDASDNVYIIDPKGNFINVDSVKEITDIHKLPEYNKKKHLYFEKIKYTVIK